MENKAAGTNFQNSPRKFQRALYTQSNKNPSAWYFARPTQAVTCGTVAIIIRVVLLSPYSWRFSFFNSLQSITPRMY